MAQVSLYTGRPRIGERLESSAYGVVVVKHVHQRGLALTVSTQSGHEVRVERAEDGWWKRHIPPGTQRLVPPYSDADLIDPPFRHDLDELDPPSTEE